MESITTNKIAIINRNQSSFWYYYVKGGIMLISCNNILMVPNILTLMTSPSLDKGNR